MGFDFNLVNNNGQGNLTLFVDGKMHIADSNHPNWNAIVGKVLAADKDVVDLFDTAKAVEAKFNVLSERVSVRGNVLYFDGDPIQGVLVDHILEFLNQGLDFDPLIAFLENVQQNPQQESRDALYSWLTATKGFGITRDGFVVGYKGVYDDGKGGYKSCNSGYGIVDGVEYQNAQLPNNPGSVVTMPRSKVAFDRNVACSTGLHIGTWEYARSFAPIVLEVHVNPRDVVSVPYDSGSQKVRACAYTVVGPVDSKSDAVLVVPVTDEVPEDDPELDDDLDLEYDDEEEERELDVGDFVYDIDGDRGELVDWNGTAGEFKIRYDNVNYGVDWVSEDNLTLAQ